MQSKRTCGVAWLPIQEPSSPPRPPRPRLLPMPRASTADATLTLEGPPSMAATKSFSTSRPSSSAPPPAALRSPSTTGRCNMYSTSGPCTPGVSAVYSSTASPRAPLPMADEMRSLRAQNEVCVSFGHKRTVVAHRCSAHSRPLTHSRLGLFAAHRRSGSTAATPAQGPGPRAASAKGTGASADALA